MDAQRDASDFLRTRRERLTPELAGLPTWGERRRVKGLRREEVALLAGVSVEYYVRLERGNLAGASDSVLDSVATALQLDDAERAHLHDLSRMAGKRTTFVRSPRRSVRPQVQWLLDSMKDTAAYVRNARMDVIAANELGRALYAPVFEMPKPNISRFVILDPRSRDFFIEWDKVAAEGVAMLRKMAGEDPYDPGLTELVGELSTRSEHFRTLWAAHNVRQHRAGIKLIHHPIVGDLTLSYESMELTADTGLRLNAYVAEPGSPSAEALGLLASWAAAPSEVPTLHD